MDWGYHTYIPVGVRVKKTQRLIEKLKQKDPSISPIVIEGKKIAKTFWGISWNKNLESYADFHNRIARGSAYLKNGMVVDLKILEGRVKSLVNGTDLYEVQIDINKLSNESWNNITKNCSHKIENIERLASGVFPEELKEIFLKKGDGLFPSPKEIKMSCTCPDWAVMCKHVAATLYGVGAKLDADPLIFFKLRGVDFSELLTKSIEEKMESMLKNSNKKTNRIIENKDISELFGI